MQCFTETILVFLLLQILNTEWKQLSRYYGSFEIIGTYQNTTFSKFEAGYYKNQELDGPGSLRRTFVTFKNMWWNWCNLLVNTLCMTVVGWFCKIMEQNPKLPSMWIGTDAYLLRPQNVFKVLVVEFPLNMCTIFGGIAEVQTLQFL